MLLLLLLLLELVLELVVVVVAAMVVVPAVPVVPVVAVLLDMRKHGHPLKQSTPPMAAATAAEASGVLLLST